MEKKFLNTKQASELLGISISTLLKRVAIQNKFKIERPIPFYKIGRTIKFERNELISFLNDR